MTTRALVPEEAHGHAYEDITNNAPRAAGDDYAQHSVARASKVADREDTNVLHEYRDLRQRKGKVVDPKSGPKHLWLGLAAFEFMSCLQGQ